MLQLLHFGEHCAQHSEYIISLSFTACTVSTVIPILNMKKLRFRKTKHFTQRFGNSVYLTRDHVCSHWTMCLHLQGMKKGSRKGVYKDGKQMCLLSFRSLKNMKISFLVCGYCFSNETREKCKTYWPTTHYIGQVSVLVFTLGALQTEHSMQLSIVSSPLY